MTDATLIIEVQAGGQTLRLSKEDALALWAELDDVFGWMSRVDRDEPEPQAPQVVGGNTCSNVRLFWDGAAQELKAVKV